MPVKKDSLELMEKHLDCSFNYDERGRMLSVNQWDGGTPPRFVLGRTSAGNTWRVRHDVPGGAVEHLADIVRQELVLHALTRQPVRRDEYLEALGRDSAIEEVGGGPCYWFERELTPSQEPVPITVHNSNLLVDTLNDWIADVPYRSPFMAVIANGKAVSVCASVRIRDSSHEAGVETTPSCRRLGYAFNAVCGWQRAVKALGAIPMYSTSWDNVASQALADRLGLTLYGVTFWIR